MDLNQIKEEVRNNLKNKHILEIEKNPDTLIKVHSYMNQFPITYRETHRSNQFGKIHRSNQFNSSSINRPNTVIETTHIVNYIFVILDIKDAKTNQMVWRGEANAPLLNNFLEGSIAPREKIIKLLVKRILKKFPPLKKKKN